MNKNAHDLNLPDWGPYGKEFVGLSHVTDVSAGDRWDCFVLPGFHRRAPIGPYAKRENRWHYWKAKPDLSSYTFRYELEWKDQVYVDVTYEGEGSGRFIRVDCVNQTELPQSLDIHLAATLSRNPLSPSNVEMPDGGQWIPALDYSEIRLSGQPHRREQTPDALKPGQWSQPGAVGGEVLGAGAFFNHPGDRVDYRYEGGAKMSDAVLLLRYHRWSSDSCRLRFEGFGRSLELDLVCDGTSMTQLAIPLGVIDEGAHDFSVELLEGTNLVLEGFAVLPKSAVSDFKVLSAESDGAAQIKESGDQYLLSYKACERSYFIEGPEGFPIRLRRVRGDDLPAILGEKANDSVSDRWVGPGERESVLLTCGPLPLEPGETRSLRFKVSLAGEAIKDVEPFGGNFQKEQPFAFGMERLAATTLCNVVFPVRHRSGYVRHNCPGRWWDSLYTWDSGMIGLGLAALDVGRAKDCLNQYLLPWDDPYAAFVEHGTPLPIQAELAREIWDQTGDKAWLAEVYPKLRNFYEWLAGRTRGSTTDRFQSGLLQTWDYFYNSGGWDDYPPQHALTEDPDRRCRIAPCVTTSYAIRFAWHMAHFGESLGETTEVYGLDVTRWSDALELAWDEESGYYSYLEHDREGQPLGIYRDESGENYNRGLDGIIPLVTGVLSDARRGRMLKNLFDSKELWTEWGATTVSRSAAYHSDAGYWNGAVWMPHNYMLYKALREQGLNENARRLAEALLGCWERECRASYHSFELFRADTGRGAGWHQFSGLSAPLLAVFRSVCEASKSD